MQARDQFVAPHVALIRRIIVLRQIRVDGIGVTGALTAIGLNGIVSTALNESFPLWSIASKLSVELFCATCTFRFRQSQQLAPEGGEKKDGPLGTFQCADQFGVGAPPHDPVDQYRVMGAIREGDRQRFFRRIEIREDLIHDLGGLRRSPQLLDRAQDRKDQIGVGRQVFCVHWGAACGRRDSRRPGYQAALASANASRAASKVAPMTSSSCALDRKPASKAEGARNTPRSSMAWKNRLNAAESQAMACA